MMEAWKEGLSGVNKPGVASANVVYGSVFRCDIVGGCDCIFLTGQATTVSLLGKPRFTTQLLQPSRSLPQHVKQLDHLVSIWGISHDNTGVVLRREMCQYRPYRKTDATYILFDPCKPRLSGVFYKIGRGCCWRGAGPCRSPPALKGGVVEAGSLAELNCKKNRGSSAFGGRSSGASPDRSSCRWATWQGILGTCCNKARFGR